MWNVFAGKGGAVCMLAEILVNRPSKHLDRTFTYRIPEKFHWLRPGWRCAVPFAGRTEEGFILSIRQEDAVPMPYPVKDLEMPVDDYPWFTGEMMELARWIASYYMCTYLDALRLFLIDKKGIQTFSFYEVCWDKIPEDHAVRALLDDSISVLTEEEASALWNGEELRLLTEQAFLVRREEIRPVYRMPLEKWILPLPVREDHPVKGKKQKDLYAFLRGYGAAPVSLLKAKGFSASVIQHFCEKGYGRSVLRRKATFSLIEKPLPKQPLVLTEEQAAALRALTKAIDDNAYSGYLVMGVTGSGKTEVYLRAAERALEQKGTVLILVPEIALTIQMVDYFSAKFGDDVVFMHSRLSRGERYNNRMRVQNGESHVVIGSRSALFLPYQNLRLIIVDEEYDASYKQDETPYYNGRDAAKKLAVIHHCPVVLGAATPAVATFYAAEQGQIHLLELKNRIHRTPLPKIHITDMRREPGGSAYSALLLREIKETAERGKKIILFRNRRGYSTSVICRDCGHVFRCPNCDVSLVFHKESRTMKCHYCGFVFPAPVKCPQCGGSALAYTGYGTEKIEEQLLEFLPEITCRRLDLDSTARKYSALQILSDFREGKFSVLLGTQMVAKGHDIPDVYLVGILSADQILNMPTYLAAEQGYILVTQCAGRAGRGLEQGEVILQTYDPDHYVIRTAAEQNYRQFYAKEIRFRKALGYPPFTKMMKITCFSKRYEEAKARADAVSAWLKTVLPKMKEPVSATPPYDESIRRVRNIYYVSIMIKGGSLLTLKHLMREAAVFQQNGIIINVDPIF